METKYIISCRGGGARGVFSAKLLKILELFLNEKGVGSFETFINLFAGTSTGGLIAESLSVGLSIDDVMDIYDKWLKYIFEKSIWRQGLTDEIYKTSNVEEAYLEVMGDRTLNDCQIPLMVTTCLGYQRHNHVFSSHNIGNIEKRGNYYLRDIARATSAAPVYFESCRINSLDGGETLDCFDGGLGRNDPSMTAYLAAKKEWPNCSIRICVVGTGIANRPITYNESKDWGAINWIMLGGCPLVSMLMAYSQDAVIDDLRNAIELFPNDKLLFLDAALVDCNDDMDDTTDLQLNALKDLARRTFASLDKNVLNNFFNPLF